MTDTTTSSTMGFVDTTEKAEKRKPNCVFSSTTDRFVLNDARNPNVRILDSKRSKRKTIVSQSSSGRQTFNGMSMGIEN